MHFLASPESISAHGRSWRKVIALGIHGTLTFHGKARGMFEAFKRTAREVGQWAKSHSKKFILGATISTILFGAVGCVEVYGVREPYYGETYYYVQETPIAAALRRAEKRRRAREWRREERQRQQMENAAQMQMLLMWKAAQPSFAPPSPPPPPPRGSNPGFGPPPSRPGPGPHHPGPWQSPPRHGPRR